MKSRPGVVRHHASTILLLTCLVSLIVAKDITTMTTTNTYFNENGLKERPTSFSSPNDNDDDDVPNFHDYLERQNSNDDQTNFFRKENREELLETIGVLTSSIDNSTDNSTCASHQTCDECNSYSSLCHWCEKDNQCHAIGSPYGCIYGSDCSSPTNSTDNSTCASHQTCDECNSYSSFCHWCESDNRCHAIGSLYGCVHGSDCSSPANSTCASRQICEECNSYSSLCHWCEFDNRCHAIGSPYGCNYGFDCSSPANSTDNSTCASHQICEECNSYSSLCHWCEFDNQCHAIGSPYGCLHGSDCPSENTTCASHKTCKECSTSSSLCHFCAFDNRCHAIGSIYGCMSGVDCYSNDRCQRNVPERKVTYFNIPAGLVVLILCLGVMIIGCLTIAVCAVSAGKGAYDDLFRLLLVRNLSEESDGTDWRRGRNDEGYSLLNYVTPKKKKRKGSYLQMASLFPSKTKDDDEMTEQGLLNFVLEEDNTAIGETQTINSNRHPSPPTTTHPPHINTTSEHINCMYNGCKFLYILSISLTLLITILAILYYPKVPEYNMCSNQLDWNSIADGMTSGKMKASFQMLMSIYNPNRFDINLEMGTGTFYHDGIYVGRFEFSTKKAKKQSINDYLVTCTFTPDQWEALALTSEYYKGTLTLVVKAQVVVDIPMLFGYSFQNTFDDYFIHVNRDETDRHLCACPTWDDVDKEEGGGDG